MRILHILRDNRSSWGGPVRSVREQARMQKDLGIEVYVLSVEREGAAEPIDDATVMTFPRTFPVRFGNSNGAIQWLRENARTFDLVLVNEIWSVMLERSMMTLRELGVPYVVQPRGSLDPYDLQKKGWLKRVLGKWIVGPNLAGSRCVLTASEAEQDRLQTFGAAVNRKTLPHPIKPNPPGDNARLRGELDIAPGTVVFLFLSRVDPKKRVDLLLEAFGNARARLPDSVLLVGGDGDARLLADLKRQANALPCAADIRFLGFQGGQRKSDLLAAANVFVLPSDFENFGIAVVEAMQAGLPVVLSEGVQLWQGIVEAGAGVAFNRGAGELSELLVRLGTDPGLRAMMSSAASSYAARFTPERLNPEYSALWRSFAKAPAATPLEA